jgi:hypothetical protein
MTATLALVFNIGAWMVVKSDPLTAPHTVPSLIDATSWLYFKQNMKSYLCEWWPEYRYLNQ